MIHPLAGKKVPKEMLENISSLVSAYYTLKPDVEVDAQKVSFEHRDTEDVPIKGVLTKIIFWL